MQTTSVHQVSWCSN